MKWTTTQFIAAGSLGILRLILSLFGGAIVVVTGIPGAGGVINVFILSIIFAYCCLLIRGFGAATIMASVYSIIAIPLPVSGTPGFLPKVMIGISTGLAADFLYLLFRRYERIFSIIVGSAISLLIAFEMVGLGKLFSMPGIDRLHTALKSPIVISSITVRGAIGGYLGWFIFNKMRDTAIVTRIQGGRS